MTNFVNNNLYSKIISFVSDIDANFPKLRKEGFNENTQLYSLLKEYSLIFRNAGHNSAEIINNDLPLKIQDLYQNDVTVKNFFDNQNF